MFTEFDKRNQYFLCRVVSTEKRVAGYIKLFVHHSKKKGSIFTEKYFDEKSKTTIDFKTGLIRGPKDKEGKPIIFATNILDNKLYTPKSIYRLYRERWSIETMYGRMKNLFNIENFHARSYNGLMQEIYANLLIINLAAIIMLNSIDYLRLKPDKVAPSFKNAAEVIRRHLFYALLKPRSENNCKEIALHMILQVSDILWKKQPDRSFPRFSRKPRNRWCESKNKRAQGIKFR